MHATSVTPLVNRLEAAGLLVRNPHPEDGRAVLASITTEGRAVMQRATDAIVEARFALGALTDEQHADRHLRPPPWWQPAATGAGCWTSELIEGT